MDRCGCCPFLGCARVGRRVNPVIAAEEALFVVAVVGVDRAEHVVKLATNTSNDRKTFMAPSWL